VPGGDFARLELPGGGGFGPPAERDPEQVAADVMDGLYTSDIALNQYPVALAADGTVNRERTAAIAIAARRRITPHHTICTP